jgi:predicted HD superfamily hydrolase involved in NAD metabolism
MDCTAERLRALLGALVGDRRRSHSEAVARLAEGLCRRFGADPLHGALAGLGHDLARELPGERLLALVERDGRPVTREERERPVLLHGRAAAAVLQREVGDCPPMVLEAVADHVTGRPGMSLLSRVLFVADYLEPGRGFPGSEEKAALLRLNLNCMVLQVLEGVIAYLRSTGQPVATQALALRQELEGAC